MVEVPFDTGGHQTAAMGCKLEHDFDEESSGWHLLGVVIEKSIDVALIVTCQWEHDCSSVGGTLLTKIHSQQQRPQFQGSQDNHHIGRTLHVRLSHPPITLPSLFSRSSSSALPAIRNFHRTLPPIFPCPLPPLVRTSRPLGLLMWTVGFKSPILLMSLKPARWNFLPPIAIIKFFPMFSHVTSLILQFINPIPPLSMNSWLRCLSGNTTLPPTLLTTIHGGSFGLTIPLSPPSQKKENPDLLLNIFVPMINSPKVTRMMPLLPLRTIKKISSSTKHITFCNLPPNICRPMEDGQSHC